MTDTTKSATPELLPCPFDESHIVRASDEGGRNHRWYGIGCMEPTCPAYLRAQVHISSDDAITAWNRRPATTPAATDERELFEATARELAFLENDEGIVNLRFLPLPGAYVDAGVSNAWKLWQAARAQLAAPRAKPDWELRLEGAEAFADAYGQDTPRSEPATGDRVTVPGAAIDWLKTHHPALCEKSGLCERIAGRLYTRTFLASAPASQAGRDALDARPLGERVKLVEDFEYAVLGFSKLGTDDARERLKRASNALVAALAGTPGAPREQQP